ERLAHDHPGRTNYATNLGGSYCNRGVLADGLRQPEAALGWYAKAVGTLESVLERQPRDALARRFLCNTYGNRARILHESARYAEALPAWERAIELAAGPNRNSLRLSRAFSLARLGRHPRAASEAEELAGWKSARPGDLYSLARVYAVCTA